MSEVRAYLHMQCRCNGLLRWVMSDAIDCFGEGLEKQRSIRFCSRKNVQLLLKASNCRLKRQLQRVDQKSLQIIIIIIMIIRFAFKVEKKYLVILHLCIIRSIYDISATPHQYLNRIMGIRRPLFSGSFLSLGFFFLVFFINAKSRLILFMGDSSVRELGCWFREGTTFANFDADKILP